MNRQTGQTLNSRMKILALVAETSDVIARSLCVFTESGSAE